MYYEHINFILYYTVVNNDYLYLSDEEQLPKPLALGSCHE